jgi:hypothetical protein
MAKRKFKGRVLRFFPDKSYGFLRLEYPASTREAMFQICNCDFGGDEVTAGDRLEVFLEDHAQGLRAVMISKV